MPNNNELNQDSSPPEQTDAHLSISAHVVVQLGEELVTDSEQALLELAKNAYDADASFCEISIEPTWEVKPGDPAFAYFATPEELEKAQIDQSPIAVGRVRIKDDGVGIPPDGVENGWLRISSSVKRAMDGGRKVKTAKLRTPVGDKGLGRLSTMKIGHVLTMRTALENETHWRTVSFSWDHFTQDRALDQVPVKIVDAKFEKDDSPGTVIDILGLKKTTAWNDPAFIENHFVPSLSALIDPFQSSEAKQSSSGKDQSSAAKNQLAADSFKITLRSAAKTFELQGLRENVLNLASAKFDFIWDEQKLTKTAFIAPSLFRGAQDIEQERVYSTIFSDEEKPKLVEWLKNDPKLQGRGISFDVASPWLCKFSDTDEDEPFKTNRLYPGALNPGPFTAAFYYFLYSQSTKNKLSSAGASANAMKAMSQVSIFRDGFKVRAQKDWLGLSEGTTSGGSWFSLRPSNVIGYFSVTNEFNPGLVEKSDREGFIENRYLNGFMALGLRSKDFANGTMEAVRKSYNDYKFQRNNGGDSKSSQELITSLESTKFQAESGIKALGAEISEMQKTLDSVIEASSVGGDTNLYATAQSAHEAKSRLESTKYKIGETLGELERYKKDSSILVEMSKDEREFGLRLLDAAAVGLAARSLTHELHQYLRQLRDGIGQVANVNKQLQNKELRQAVLTLNSITRELAKLISTIDPMLPGSRSLKEEIGLVDFFDRFIDGRTAAATKKGITIKFDRGQNEKQLKIRFSRTRLLQVVENLFQNSLYWLTMGPCPDSQIRQIVITITENGFKWADTGPGFKPSLEHSIFDPYVSDKPNAEGSGLGLHIASTFLEQERSSIQISGPKNRLKRRSELTIDLSGARVDNYQKQLDV